VFKHDSNSVRSDRIESRFVPLASDRLHRSMHFSFHTLPATVLKDFHRKGLRRLNTTSIVIDPHLDSGKLDWSSKLDFEPIGF
jgi:hypothetical protein